MPSMSETNGMENMLGTTQKESTEGRRSKGALLASKRKTWALQRGQKQLRLRAEKRPYRRRCLCFSGLVFGVDEKAWARWLERLFCGCCLHQAFLSWNQALSLPMPIWLLKLRSLLHWLPCPWQARWDDLARTPIIELNPCLCSRVAKTADLRYRPNRFAPAVFRTPETRNWCRRPN